MKKVEKLALKAVKAVAEMKEKSNFDLYRSPTFFHQPKRPVKK